MDKNKLDKYLKDQLYTYESSADPNSFYAKLQKKKKLEEKSKRKFLLIWFFFGLAAMFAITSYFVYFHNDEIITSTVEINQSIHSNKSQIEENDNQLVINNKELSTLTENEEQSRQKVVRVKPSNENKKTSQNNSINKSLSLKGTIDVIPANEKFTTVENHTEKESHVEPEITDVPFVKNENIPKKNNAQNSINLGNEPVSIVSKNQELYTEIFKKDESQKNKWAEHEVKLQSTELMPLKLVDAFPAISRAISIKDFSQNEGLKHNQLPTAKEKKWKMNYGLSYSYGMVFKDLSLKNKNGEQDYVALRQKTETPLDAFEFSVDVLLQNKSGIYWKSGISYSQINERFENRFTWDSISFYENVVTSVHFREDGSSYEETLDTEVPTEYFISKKIYNRYHSLDIPLSIGYLHNKNNKRLHYFLEAGALVNLYFKANGEILNKDATAIILKQRDDLFKKNIGLSVYCAAGLSYEIHKKLRVHVAPTFKYQPFNINHGENTINQKYNIASMRIGFLWQY